MSAAEPAILKQHLIDPVICIRCNTCEETCPIDAITHDLRNYVVNADICNGCGACVSPCPTGAIDNWRNVVKARAYAVEEQLLWDELPPEQDLAETAVPVADSAEGVVIPPVDGLRGSVIAPKTAARPSVNLHTIRHVATATVAGNVQVTAAGRDSDTHHVVLDFGSLPFPVREGQSIGIIPPGVDASGRPLYARQYSIASPRDGERPKYNNLSITVKRVTIDHNGKPKHGVASNYVCNLKKGDTVQVIGPFGSSFLMPDDPAAHLLMVCTGTGSAPMRAMTERRRRLRAAGDGKLMLFFGARTPEELPYFGPLMQLPKDFIDNNLAFSRVPGKPRDYVQDLIRRRAADVAALLADERTHVYVCGLRGMEDGVMAAFEAAVSGAGDDWPALHTQLKMQGRIHLETY